MLSINQEYGDHYLYNRSRRRGQSRAGHLGPPGLCIVIVCTCVSVGERMEFYNFSGNKLSYRRYSARRLSLRHSRSFKVTDVDTNRKLLCNFPVNRPINPHPINIFQLSSCRLLVELSPLTRGVSRIDSQ